MSGARLKLEHVLSLKPAPDTDPAPIPDVRNRVLIQGSQVLSIWSSVDQSPDTEPAPIPEVRNWVLI